ncbi:MAG: 3-hydroxyacyl-CoA dehydrogenase family protein [Desulfocucumaceae bacterium]
MTTKKEIDYALCSGVGFPKSKGGPLRYADAEGLKSILEKLEFYAQKDNRFWPAYLIRKMVSAGYLGAESKMGFYQY